MNENKNIAITYLYSEVMAYTIGVMRELVHSFNALVFCVYWDKKKGTPFIPENEHQITFHKRSEYEKNTLIKLVESQNPSIIYVSGTMDKTYLEVALYFKSKGIKIVAGSDNQWINSWKQQIQTKLSFILFKKYFNYIWIPGSRQYTFARLMGFADNEIIKNLYSANTPIFNEAFQQNILKKSQKFPHTFVFVGRFVPAKGIDILVKAFNEVKKEMENDWKLVLIGASDNTEYQSTKDMEVLFFLPNSELANQSKNWGVFCLPSIKEAWGVVLHEFAASGFPIICSNGVGASDAFLITGYNGYSFETGNWIELKQRLLFIMQKTDEELVTMGKRSNQLAQNINPQIAAYSLMSILHQ